MLGRWRGFPLQLFVFTILPITVLLAGIAFGSLALHQQAMRTLVGERDERATRAAASAITEQLNHRAAVVRSLVVQVATTGSPEHALNDAAPYLSDFEGGLAVLEPDGALLATIGAAENWEDTTVSQRLAELGRDSQASNEVQFDSGFADLSNGEELMLVATANPGGLVAAGAFSPSSLARRALTDIFNTSDRATAFLVDANGQIIYGLGTLPAIESEIMQHPGVADALRGESGTTFLSIGGDEHVIAFSPVFPVNWALVFEEPWRAVAGPLLRTTQLVPLILVPALALALVGLWLGLRQIVQPLQALEQKATKLAWGDFEAIEEPVGGINEIERLQAELIHMAQKVKAAQLGLRGYLGIVTAGQEEELRRLARELHDDTIQSLIALSHRAQLAQTREEGHPSIEQLEEMEGMIQQMISDLRRLTRDLRPIYLEELGLVPALDMLARDTGNALNIPVTFETSGTNRRLQAEVELALYRMVQEALSNVARHANATSAAVTLDYGAGEITLTVTDDGRGFEVPESPAEMAPEGHYGLLGLHERAELIGARMAIQSALDHGTRVTVILPTLDPPIRENRPPG